MEVRFILLTLLIIISRNNNAVTTTECTKCAENIPLPEESCVTATPRWKKILNCVSKHCSNEQRVAGEVQQICLLRNVQPPPDEVYLKEGNTTEDAKTNLQPKCFKVQECHTELMRYHKYKIEFNIDDFMDCNIFYKHWYEHPTCDKEIVEKSFNCHIKTAKNAYTEGGIYGEMKEKMRSLPCDYQLRGFEADEN